MFLLTNCALSHGRISKSLRIHDAIASTCTRQDLTLLICVTLLICAQGSEANLLIAYQLVHYKRLIVRNPFVAVPIVPI